jgi:hypothetical protein
MNDMNRKEAIEFLSDKLLELCDRASSGKKYNDDIRGYRNAIKCLMEKEEKNEQEIY